MTSLSTSAASPVPADVADSLVRRAELQANLFDRGDMERWWAMIGLGDGFTLFEPFGGVASHGFDATPERLAALAANFRNGVATIELQRSYIGSDIAVLVYVERQTGEVHGLPDQDWSLRVTQVFELQQGAWRLVHRHADPLVRPIQLPVLSALAAGTPLVAAPDTIAR